MYTALPHPRILGPLAAALFALCLTSAPPASAVLTCPPGSVFVQAPNPGLEPPMARWISSETQAGLIAADHFTGLAGPFNQVTWWGNAETIEDTPQICVENPVNFRVVVFEDDGGMPGNEVFQAVVAPQRVNTGEININTPIYRYTATLPETLNVTDGWIAVQGVGDPDCHFFWLTTQTGAGNHQLHQRLGPTWTERPNHLAVCLSLENGLDPGAPIVRHVRPNVNPTIGDGSAAQPWGSIGHALEQIAPLGVPVILELRQGLYEENLELVRNVTLRGIRLAPREPNPADRFPELEFARIRGEIIAARGATIEDVIIEAPAEGASLLWSEVRDLTVRRVIFEGTPARTAFGIVLRGDTRGTLIEDSRFELLDVALDVGGPLPRLRRSVFDNQGSTHLFLRATGAKQAGGEDGLGRVSDPNAGFNLLGDSTSGIAVISERDEAVFMQNNEWGTNEPAEIAERIDQRGEGDVIFNPALPVGNAILAAAIYCTILDAETEAPITNATVSLTPSPFNPVTENLDGVYSFAAITPNSYTLRVDHPLLATQTRSVNVEGGQTVSLDVFLSAPAPGCFGKAEMASRAHTGDTLLLALALLGLAGMGRRARRGAP